MNGEIHLDLSAEQTIMVLHIHKEKSYKTLTHKEMKPSVPQNLGDFELTKKEETHFFSLCG